MTRHVLLDTGPLVGMLRSEDANHSLCLDHLKSIKPPLLTCLPIITEAAWLLRHQKSAVARLLQMPHEGAVQLLSLDASDLCSIAEIVDKYHDLRLQFADACLMHLAERENLQTLFTLDHRDFSVVRLRNNRRLRLVPKL